MHTPAGVEALEFGVRGALCPGVMLLAFHPLPHGSADLAIRFM